MADVLSVLWAIVVGLVTAGFYAFLSYARSRDPVTGEFENFRTEKFVRTILLALVVGGIAGALGLATPADVEAYLGPGGYGLLTILVQLAAQAISRRVGWT